MEIQYTAKSSLENQIRKRIFRRIATCFILMFSFTLFFTRYGFITNLVKLEQQIKDRSKILADYSSTQKLINNINAIQLKIDDENKKMLQ